MIVNNLKNIKKLLINSNKFDASALVNLPTLTNLKVLQVNMNELGDTCLDYISKLPNLS